MKNYRIYFLAADGKIAGRPAELQAASDSEVIMRALLSDRNLHGAEVWCGATLVRRVSHATEQDSVFVAPAAAATQPGALR